MGTTLAKLLKLKPYDDHLLDGMAEIWLVLARLNILSIALCDAAAWGYFAWTATTGVAAYAASAVAALVVFGLVASVDAMFIMHDRENRREGGSLIARSFTRDRVAILARVVLVILTFTVTAPFLTQLFFARDIEAAIRRHNEQRVSSARARIASAADQDLQHLRSTLDSRRRDLEREIAGSGTSGRYGKGPTAAAIEREIAALSNEISATGARKERELGHFDRASAVPEELANRYGVDLVREGPDTRARVVASLEANPSFRATRISIKAFLLFMFLGLVCLKLFQPESVRIYYSARLQAAYARMKAGVFDQRLDPREKLANGGMTPLRFADWYDNDQQVRDGTERLRDQTASAIERLRVQEDAVRVLQETLLGDLTRLREELAGVARNGEELEQQTGAVRRELHQLQAKIAEEQQALDEFSVDAAGDLPLRDQHLLIASRTRTVRQLADRRAVAESLTNSLETLTRRLDGNRACEAQLRSAVAVAESEVTSLAGSIQEARQRRLAEIVAG